jgi:hypothetical protein
MWSGAQPTATVSNQTQNLDSSKLTLQVTQEFNQTYYDIISEIVDNLAEAGMYTLFDMHQVHSLRAQATHVAVC